jgi:hypothetical protein
MDGIRKTDAKTRCNQCKGSRTHRLDQNLCDTEDVGLAVQLESNFQRENGAKPVTRYD